MLDKLDLLIFCVICFGASLCIYGNEPCSYFCIVVLMSFSVYLFAVSNKELISLCYFCVFVVRAR